MFVTAIAALLSIAGTPVGEMGKTPATAPAAAPEPLVASASGTSHRAYNPRVCIEEALTGSRIPRRECRPLAQWRTLGIDPLPRR